MRFKEWFILITEGLKEDLIRKFKTPDVDDNTIKFYIDKFFQYKSKIKPNTLNDNQELKDIQDKSNIQQYKIFEQLEIIVDYMEALEHSGYAKSQQTIEDKPIHEVNGLKIYLGDSKHKCIHYGKGYSFCISRPYEGNLFNNYRYAGNEPIFYFVVDESRSDKYKMLVIHANNNDTYKITNANNDGDKNSTWEEIEKMQPKLKGLQHIFKSKPLTNNERFLYNKFSKKIDNEEFLHLSDFEKEAYIDMYVNPYNDRDLTIEQFASLSKNLKNKYILLGYGLTYQQYELIKHDVGLMKLLEEITKRRLDKFNEIKDYLRYSDIVFDKDNLIDNQERFNLAAKEGSIEIIKLLMDKVKYYQEAFNLAAFNGHIEIVKLLMDKVKYYQEAFNLAAFNGHIEIVKLLIDKVKYYQEAFNNSAIYGNIEIVKLLMSKVNDYQFAFDNAALKGHVDIVKLLIDKVNSYQYAFNLATLNGRIDIVKLLIDKVDKYQDAFDFAALNGQIEIVKLLMDKVKHYKTAFNNAIENGHKEIAELIRNKMNK